MAEIPDRTPGSVILASYANTIRDRTVQRYIDATARDASLPIPVDGDVAWLTATDVLQVFNGTVWLDIAATVELIALDARLDIFEAQVWSPFNGATQDATSGIDPLSSLTVVTSGDYIATFTVEADVNGSAQGSLDFELFVETALKVTYRQTETGPASSHFQTMTFVHGLPGLLVGETVKVAVDSSGSINSSFVKNTQLSIAGIPVGILP